MWRKRRNGKGENEEIRDNGVNKMEEEEIKKGREMEEGRNFERMTQGLDEGENERDE